ncbi:MAG: hypothetical protein ABIF11_06305 [Nitrospirota bacterium]
MVYLNECPKCSSKEINIIKKIRFSKTIYVLLFISLFCIIGCIYDMRNIYAQAALDTERGILGLITIGCWFLSMILVFIKKITYQCKDCNLKWEK